MKKNHLTLILSIGLLICLTFTGCSDDIDVVSNVVIYENDFEERDLTNINGGILFRRFNTTLIGNYNNGGFTLHLDSIPDHDYIYISFTLHIHDTWDGNSNGLEPDAPDKWIMAVNPGINSTSLDDYRGFETTFSNGPCDGVLCLPQSYPNEFPHHNLPRTGARRPRSGMCVARTVSGSSSEYFIERTFLHDDPTISFSFYDELYQSNVLDQKCDESWSMDNIEIRAITLD